MLKNPVDLEIYNYSRRVRRSIVGNWVLKNNICFDSYKKLVIVLFITNQYLISSCDEVSVKHDLINHFKA